MANDHNYGSLARRHGATVQLKPDVAASSSVLVSFTNPRCRSLTRGNILAFGSIALGYRLSGFPQFHANGLLFLPVMLSILGTADTARCMKKRWDFYHAGVLLLLYADLMGVVMLAFLWLYPYTLWISRL